MADSCPREDLDVVFWELLSSSRAIYLEIPDFKIYGVSIT